MTRIATAALAVLLLAGCTTRDRLPEPSPTRKPYPSNYYFGAEIACPAHHNHGVIVSGRTADFYGDVLWFPVINPYWQPGLLKKKCSVYVREMAKARARAAQADRVDAKRERLEEAMQLKLDKETPLP